MIGTCMLAGKVNKKHEEIFGCRGHFAFSVPRFT